MSSSPAENENERHRHSSPHDSDDESDMGVVRGPDLGPNSGPESDSGSASGYDYESDDSLGNGFIDLEASESGDEFGDGFESRDDDDDEGDDDDQIGDDSEPHFFPQFKRFPIEVRYRIWECFCPDLTASGRVYEEPVTRDPMLLADRTAASRAVLAVHHESRDFALKSLPHTLDIRTSSRISDGIIRFHREKDIIITTRNSSRTREGAFEIAGGQIYNVGLVMDLFVDQAQLSQTLARLYPNARNVFCVVEDDECPTAILKWCASDQTKASPITVFNETLELGIPATYRETFCWPDVDKNRQFAEKEVPLHELWITAGLADYPDSDNPRRAVRNQLSGLPIWPLVKFSDSSIERLALIREGKWTEADGEFESESFYGGSGIDDSDIEEGSSDGTEDDLEVVEGGDESSDDGNSDESDGEEIAAPEDHHDGLIGLTEDGEIPLAQFSSPEPDSATVRGDSDDSDADAQMAPRPALKRSRKRVVDDSDEESEDEAPRKRIRCARRVQSSQEESSSEDSARGGISSEESEEESGAESEDEEDEEDAPPKRMSLAEKLQLHRQQNPIPDADSDLDPEDKDLMGMDVYDARAYGNFDDNEDEEDEEDSHDQLSVDLDEQDDDDDNGY